MDSKELMGQLRQEAEQRREEIDTWIATNDLDIDIQKHIDAWHERSPALRDSLLAIAFDALCLSSAATDCNVLLERSLSSSVSIDMTEFVSMLNNTSRIRYLDFIMEYMNINQADADLLRTTFIRSFYAKETYNAKKISGPKRD